MYSDIDVLKLTDGARHPDFLLQTLDFSYLIKLTVHQYQIILTI